MSIQRRAIRAAIVCGLWLFSNLSTLPSAVAIGSESEGETASTGPWLEIEALAEKILAPWRDAIATSPELSRFHAFVTEPMGVAILLALAALLVGGLVLTRWRSRSGLLSLHIGFPEQIEGEFEIALHRKSTRRSSGRNASKSRGPAWARRGQSRQGVRRETQFDRLAPGRWFVTIEGTLRAPHSGAELAQIDEEHAVFVTAHESTTLDMALPVVEAPVEIRIHWDRQPARDVGLGLRGRPESLRYASQGVARSRLSLGRHIFMIGAGDRVVELEVDIPDYEPSIVSIDLATSRNLVFKGCPPAVSSFLQGDLRGAARALERDGQNDVAHLLLARLHQEQGQSERAAEQLENAGRLREAADLRRAISELDRAASLYERANEPRLAAETYDAAGSWAEAARVYAALEDWANAARCYEQAGDVEHLIDALEARGELIRAAALASERDDRARAIRLLQKVPPGSPDFGRATELLALAFEHEGHFDLAAQKLELRLDSLGPDETAPQLELQLAELLCETGEWVRALEVLQRLRDRDPTFPNVASRIESLRKKLSSPPRSGAGFTPPPGATAFVAEERYEIFEEIGRGGMGLVYKARDRRLGRDVALKRMPENLRAHTGAVGLFLGEAQAAARMNHPNIVTLYDADQEHGHFFITMELLEGLPLNTILQQRGRFGPRDTARLGMQVCAGLQYAHEQGIVHRDIKTANLFITREKVLKIMDFGLAKILEAVREDGATMIAGTPFYMAPEQSAGRVVDGRTDLYALGVTLFELSTGRLPFQEGNVAEQHLSTPPPDPGAGMRGYPAALSQLIQELMAKRPEDRPASAAIVAMRLKALIDAPTR